MSSARAVVAGHGDFAAGMISAVDQITGRGSDLVAMTNRGLSAPDVAAALGALLDATRAQVVFTDLPAGSCTMAARRVQRERPGLTIIVGTNLATLLDFVFAEGEPGDAAVHAAEKGRAALMPVGGTARGT